MTSSSWADRMRRIEEVLSAAIELDPARRDGFLDTACAGDPYLRGEVVSLLAAHERPGPLDQLASDMASLAGRIRLPDAPMTGETVGHYQVLEAIGHGGMGVVHKALDSRLGRTVALKFLRARAGTGESAVERFRLEARAVAALEHPNICTLLEIGETDLGQLYLAMPFYDGETIEQRIARGPLPVAEAVEIASQVARGLAKAHAGGIIHRDVKPSNLLVTGDGVVKILDFGIAKLAGVSITGAAGPLGTLAYMSPEQASGGSVDQRTDLWSLGVVLYEMLTGRRPYAAETPAEVMRVIRDATPAPVGAGRSDIPPALDRIVVTAMNRRLHARYQSAVEMERALAASDRSAPSPAPTPGPAHRLARSADPADRGTADSVAYDLYLKGRLSWDRRTEQGLRAAAAAFERAVVRAPSYARAHAALAEVQSVLGFYDCLPPAEAYPRAEVAARRAVALDPTLAAPRATLGCVAFYYHWDPSRAEEELRRAIDLDPGYSAAHQWYANLLVAAGRFADAVDEMERALESDPVSPITRAGLGWVLYHAGDSAGAVEQCRRALELSADYAAALLWCGWALEQTGSPAEAVSALRRSVAESEGGGLYLASLARALALAGEREEAESLLRRLVGRTDGGGYVPSYEIAKAHAALGRPDQAFAWLDRALAERSHSMMLLRVDPQLVGLRADPRFARLVARVQPQ